MQNCKPFVVFLATAMTSSLAVAATPEEIRALSPQAPGVVAPAIADPDVHVFNAGAHFFKRVLTSTKPQTIMSEVFIPLAGAKTVITVQPGTAVLVNVGFTAESRCSEFGSVEPNWCETRVLIDGVEAAPAASSFPADTYAFDSTNAGSDGTNSWESHAMDRHRCIVNNTPTFMSVPVQVEWKVTNFGGGAAPEFWLDDWSLTIEMARGCRESTQTF